MRICGNMKAGGHGVCFAVENRKIIMRKDLKKSYGKEWL